MRETIYSIPINAAFDGRCGCPFCALRREQEQSTLDYTLGAAMMEPNVRISLNAAGFCKRHFTELSAKKNKLALALILESRFAALVADFEGALRGECFICSRVNNTERRILSNALFLFASEAEFRAKFAAQEYICLEHARMLFLMAERELKRKEQQRFKDALFEVLRGTLDALRADARKFSDSFDYRVAGTPMGDERLVFEKAAPIM